MKSAEKWPCTIKITKVSEGITNEALTSYLITGGMNKNQVNTMANRMAIHSTIQFEDDTYAIASLVTHTQLQKLYATFEPLSRSWRGQYQVLTKEFVRAYHEEISTGDT